MSEYWKTIRVALPECDCRNRMKLSSVMRHGQEVSSEHLDALGLPHRLLWDEGFVYLLTRAALRITRRPQAGETVRIRTCPRKPKGVQSLREIWFYDEAGAELIAAQTAWVLADPAEHRIRRPSELPHVIPTQEGGEPCCAPRGRIRRPENAGEALRRTVRYSDLDCNRHMNNAVYLDVVCDALPCELLERCEFSAYEIAFIGEARLGEELRVLRAQTGETDWYVGADRAAGDRCFEAALTLRPGG